MNPMMNNAGAHDSGDTLAILGQDQQPRSTVAPMMGALEGTKPRKRIQLGPVVMVVVLAAAGGLLFGMRQMGLGPKFSFASETATATVPEQNRNAAANQEILLAELGALRTANQVPIEKLRKNPFMLAYSTGPAKTTENIDPNDPDAARKLADRALAERLAKSQAERVHNVKQKLAEMELQSVVGGGRPIARISGKVYRVGDLVSDYFTIKTISGRSIEVEADGELFVIEMGEGGAKK
ncbi:hypothetical protein BH11PLA1_BH11PLA1_18960 [soil metagenome]